MTVPATAQQEAINEAAMRLIRDLSALAAMTTGEAQNQMIDAVGCVAKARSLSLKGCKLKGAP